MQEPKEFTRQEVERTKGSGRTLIILHDKVYDVTDFLNEHPGGEEILIDHARKDASDDFDDVGHSQDALNLMKKYLLGDLVVSERSNRPMKKGWVAGYNSKQPEKEKYVQGPGAPFYMLASAMILAIAVVFYAMS